MEIKTHACDICTVQKQGANHWWRIHKRIDGGVVITRWEDTPTTDDVENFEAHLCGANCVHEWLSKNLL